MRMLYSNLPSYDAYSIKHIGNVFEPAAFCESVFIGAKRRDIGFFQALNNLVQRISHYVDVINTKIRFRRKRIVVHIFRTHSHGLHGISINSRPSIHYEIVLLCTIYLWLFHDFTTCPACNKFVFQSFRISKALFWGH